MAGMPAFAPEPPPPPPKKTGIWVWIVIGCGTLLVVGGLVCGGCLWWGWGMASSMVKIQQDVAVTLRTDPRVQAEFGTVRSVEPIQGQPDPKSGSSEFPMRFHIQGSRRSGVAEATLSFDGRNFKLVSLRIEKEDGSFIDLK